MKQLTLTVIEPAGIDARPVTISCNIANKFVSKISLTHQGKRVNMKSIMGVMSLAIPPKSTIDITCEGSDEDIAIASIQEVLKEEKIAV